MAMKKLAAVLTCALFWVSPAGGADVMYDLTYGPTDTWVDFYSPNSPDLDIGDQVAVLADGIVIGVFGVDSDDIYGFLHSYGDDATTPYKDGAYAGDVLEFQIYDAGTQLRHFADNFPAEVEWTSNGDRIQVDLVMGPPVPEPATLALFAAGSCLVLTRRRRS